MKQAFIYLTMLMILFSCNNEAKNNNTSEKADTSETKLPQKSPKPLAIKAFHKYKIGKSMINTSDKKLVLTVAFDDLTDPTEMSLYFFPVTTGGVFGNPIMVDNLADQASPFDTKDILISNNEIILANYNWKNIDYLVLEPARKTDNLGFTITAFKNASQDTPVEEVQLPIPARSTKPSPPAPPQTILKQNKLEPK